MRAKPRFPRAKVYDLVVEAVEFGVRLGWNRAHKHTPTPSEEVFKDAMERAIMECIDERFHLL